ncbi:MAG: transglycosylase SLT domain-containing protein, partial [Gemmatimonadetes bacterium]|nr:transglycosylase SLT domain-containing protein [Gemmatimonadota bacterium]
MFDRAASHAAGVRQGTLRARAAESYERAGLLGRASSLYRQAAIDFPDARGWLALREARVTRDPSRARELLRLAPAAAHELAAEVRATLLAGAGDLGAAAEVLADVGHFAAAGRLALEAGDNGRARELVYRAIAVRDRDEAMTGVEIALAEFPPADEEGHLAVAQAISRYGQAAAAVRHAADAVTAGDSSIGTLLFYAEVTEASGNRWGALRIYEAAAKRGGEEAGEAEYRYARTYVRLRQRTRAFQALSAFLEKYPDHRRAPATTFLMGDLRQDQRKLREADSIFRALSERWPTDEFASSARSRLGARALVEGDLKRSTEIFRAEVEHRGSRARAAQFQIARLAKDAGDTVTALGEWAALARLDSIGYYGTMARQAAGLAAPVFAPPPATLPSPEVTRQLAVLDLLQAVDLRDEADALLDYLSDPDRWGVTELMDVAEGLIARGEARSAVALGWRIAGLHRLNDPRVLRIIFPWPNRQLLEREAREFDLDPFLLAALVRQESAFDADATSRAGARGLMQLMPATAR